MSLLLVSSCQKEERVIVQEKQVLEVTNSSGGGVIDGGGSDQEYSSREYFDATLKKVIRNLKSRNPFENVLLISHEALVTDFFDSSIERRNQVYKQDLRHFFSLVTDRFNKFAYMDREGCERDGVDKYLEDHAYRNFHLRGSTCREIFPIQDAPLESVLDEDKIDIEQQCFDHFGNERIASVEDFSKTSRICLSWTKFSRIHKADLEKNIMKILVHELVHLYGIKEELHAVMIEEFIEDNFDEFENIIKENKKDFESQRKELITIVEDKKNSLVDFLKDDEVLFDLASDDMSGFITELEDKLVPGDVLSFEDMFHNKIEMLFSNATLNSYNVLMRKISISRPREDIEINDHQKRYFIENIGHVENQVNELLLNMRSQNISDPPKTFISILEKYENDAYLNSKEDQDE